MKKTIWFLLILLPFAGKAQPGGWTPEQQEQFRQQMEQFKIQMEQQMQSLRDSLTQMNVALKDFDESLFDSMDFGFGEMPSPPDMPLFEEGYEYYYDGDDSTEMRLGKWKMVIQDEGGDEHVRVYKDESCEEEEDDGEENELNNIETKFLLLDVGVNNYFRKGFESGLPSGYDAFEPIPGKSWVVNIHLVNQRLNLINYHLWLTYGIFFEFNSYKYNNDNVLVPKIDSVAFEASDVPLNKNKLSSEYIGIPVMLRFETKPADFENSFHISVGGFGEYLLGAHTKTKSNEDDKTKKHDDFNLNTFRYGAAARVGYGWFSLFTNIAVSELLKDNTGPVLYPFSAGLAFEF